MRKSVLKFAWDIITETWIRKALAIIVFLYIPLITILIIYKGRGQLVIDMVITLLAFCLVILSQLFVAMWRMYTKGSDIKNIMTMETWLLFKVVGTLIIICLVGLGIAVFFNVGK